MRMSQFFIQTLREAPGTAGTAGYRWLVRAGFLRTLPGGVAWLPAGVAARTQIEARAADTLRAEGGQPVDLPLAQYAETAVNEAGSTRFRDRTGRELVLPADHTAACLAAAASVVQSYRQLPALLYENWSPFGAMQRPAGGLLDAREGRVLDAYGLHASETEVADQIARIGEAWGDLLHGWGLPAQSVIAAESAAGQPSGYRWTLPHPDGAETVARCLACGYAATQSAARVDKRPPTAEPAQPLQPVATPECKTIAELAAFLGIPASRTAKAVFLNARTAGQADRFVFAVVRGDTALDADKLCRVIGADAVEPATEDAIRQAGAEPGYGSPVGLTGVTVVADDLAAASPNLVAGANRPGYHLRNVNYGRDYAAALVADIAAAQDGSPCPRCGAALRLENSVTLAEAVALGAMSATHLDRAGRAQPLALGWFRFCVDRVLGAIAENHYDEHGLLWPVSAAPFLVYLMSVGKAGSEVTLVADRLYAELAAAGVRVLYDDRDERAGVKFNDADLIGAPLRIAIGERGLKTGAVEAKRRGSGTVELVAVEEVVRYVGEALST